MLNEEKEELTLYTESQLKIDVINGIKKRLDHKWLEILHYINSLD